MPREKDYPTNLMFSENARKDRELFNRIVVEYTRKDLDPSASIARKHRLFATVDSLPAKLKNYRILEVGCAGGFTTRYLQGKYREYVGVDYAEELIDYARSHNKTNSAVSFETCAIRNYQADEFFDVILLIGVLHHLDELHSNLLHLRSLLKPEGFILANEPQSKNMLINLTRKARSRFDRNYSAHQKYFSPTVLKQAFEEAGFTDVSIKAQGILSTPFAEVVLSPNWLFRPITYVTVKIDTFLERIFGRMLLLFSWNAIAIGRAPTIDIDKNQ